MHLTFRQVTTQDAAMLLEWRRRPEITRHMYTDIDHDVAAQRQWIGERAVADDFRHFVIEYDGTPAGYLSFSEIDAAKRQCSTGFYLAERAPGQQYAGILDVCMVDYAFHVLNMERIENGVLKGNDRSVVFHEKAGFKRRATKADHVVKRGIAIDVYVYVLTRTDWEARERPFPVAESLAAFAAL